MKILSNNQKFPNDSIWDTFDQSKYLEYVDPIKIISAKDSYIYTEEGKCIVDAISNKCFKSLGHNNLYIKESVLQQIKKFESADYTCIAYEIIEKLSKKIESLTNNQCKIFYSNNSSSAIENALKLSLYLRKISGESEKNYFLSLKNSYHGKTLATSSVSDIKNILNKNYSINFFNTIILDEVPYCLGPDDPTWYDITNIWPKVLKKLEPYVNKISALILEPLIQEKTGIKIYSLDFLKKIKIWTEKNNIHLIADERITGVGRTGEMLTFNHINEIPDMICLSKGLTSGWGSLSALLVKKNLTNLFCKNDKQNFNDFKVQSYINSAIGTASALSTLNYIEKNNILQKIPKINKLMVENMHQIANKTGFLTNVRSIGAIVAADIDTKKLNTKIIYDKIQNKTIYQTSQNLSLKYKINQLSRKNDILLEPINNTIYWAPPLNVKYDILEEIKYKTLKTLMEID